MPNLSRLEEKRPLLLKFRFYNHSYLTDRTVVMTGLSDPRQSAFATKEIQSPVQEWYKKVQNSFLLPPQLATRGLGLCRGFQGLTLGKVVCALAPAN